MKRSIALFSVLSTALLSGAAHADNAVAQQALAKGKALFAARSATSLASVNEALQVLESAEAQADDAELKYDILVLASRAYYFLGTHTQGDSAKKEIHLKGKAKAVAADELELDFAEAPYFAGVHLARWGEANGIVASLKQVPELKKFMSSAMDRETRDGKAGESVDGFGPHRTLGRMLKKLPGLFGGSHAGSVKELQAAVKGDPTTALNVVYLADSLMKDGNEAEKAEGRQLLNDLLTKNPGTLNAERVAETTEEFALARDVLAGKEIN